MAAGTGLPGPWNRASSAAHGKNKKMREFASAKARKMRGCLALAVGVILKAGDNRKWEYCPITTYDRVLQPSSPLRSHRENPQSYAPILHVCTLFIADTIPVGWA
jgi:hypothetical protein